MLGLFATCPQCSWNTCDHGHTSDLSNVIFLCDGCGAGFSASFGVICKDTNLIKKGDNWDEDTE